MSQELVKQFWEKYRKAKKREDRLKFLAEVKVLLEKETDGLHSTFDHFMLLKSCWKDSAEMYDTLSEVRALNLEIVLHVQQYAHTMSPELLGRIMRTWAALNDYFKSLNTARALIEDNQDLAVVLDLINQRRKKTK